MDISNIHNERLIIRLLHQSIMIHRLTRGLEKLGFYSEETYDEIAELVFDLMGCRNMENCDALNDSFLRIYVRFFSQIDSGRLGDRNYTGKSAVDLYRQLKTIRHR